MGVADDADLGDVAFDCTQVDHAADNLLRRNDDLREDVAITTVFRGERVAQNEHLREGHSFSNQVVIEGSEIGGLVDRAVIEDDGTQDEVDLQCLGRRHRHLRAGNDNFRHSLRLEALLDAVGAGGTRK